MVSEVGHDVDAARSDGEVTGKNLRVVERVDAGCVENMHSEAPMLLAKRTRSAVVPPETDRLPDESSIQSAETAPQKRVDQATPNESRTVDAACGLAAPVVANALVAQETCNVVGTQSLGGWAAATRQRKKDGCKKGDAKQSVPQQPLSPDYGDEAEPNGEHQGEADNARNAIADRKKCQCDQEAKRGKPEQPLHSS